MSSGYRSSPCLKWCPTLKELHSPRVRKHCQIISQFFPEIVYCGKVCSKAKYDATISANNVIRMTSFVRRGGWPLLFPRRMENNSHAKVFPWSAYSSSWCVYLFIYLPWKLTEVGEMETAVVIWVMCLACGLHLVHAGG